MNTGNILAPLAIMTLTFLANQNAMAGKVYQWTDEEGVVHFSDVPPADATTTDMREINIDILVDENADPDEFSIINQADRMAERRRQTTEERLAVKRLQLEEQRLSNESRQRAIVISEPRYEPYYSYGYSQPHIYYQRRQFYNQPGFFPYPSMRPHQGWISKGHQPAVRHHSKIGLQF